MFNRAIQGQLWMPKYLSSDNDPLYRFQQWHANLRILEVTGIKSIPYVPCPIHSWKGSSAPFDASIGSHVVLNNGRSRKQAARFQDLLQQPSHAYQSQTSARFDGNLTVVTYIRHQWLRNFPRLSIAAYPVNLGKTSKLPTKPSTVCVLGRRAPRGSDRFSSIVSIRQRQVVALGPSLIANVVQTPFSGLAVIGLLLLELLDSFFIFDT